MGKPPRSDDDAFVDDDGRVYLNGECLGDVFVDPADLRKEIFAKIMADANRWNAHRDKQTARSKAGVETKRDNRTHDNLDLRALVEKIRRQHREWSQRAVAREVLRRSGKPIDDKPINACAARIARLTKPL